MTEQELDLFEFAPSVVAEPSTRYDEHAAFGMSAAMPNFGLCRIAGQVALSDSLSPVRGLQRFGIIMLTRAYT